MIQTGKKLEHLAKVSREHPEYRDILKLFHELFAYINGKEDGTGLAFTVPDKHREERISGGIPFVTADDLEVERDQAVTFLMGVLTVMKRVSKEGGEELEKIEGSLNNDSLDLQTALAACLARERESVDRAAQEISVQPPILEFVLQIPLKTALEHLSLSVKPEDFKGWEEGYCPLCGSRAGMAELVGEEGKRYLACSTCFSRWPFKRMKCPYCGNENAEELSYFVAGEGPVRVDTCIGCSRFIKTRDSRLGNADVPLEIEDLTTIHLDLLAEKEGFARGK